MEMIENVFVELFYHPYPRCQAFFGDFLIFWENESKSSAEGNEISYG